MLFRHFNARLSRYLRAREPAASDDLLGDVWLAVAGHLDEFEGNERAFGAWLFTLTRNLVAGHRRKRRRQRTDLTDPGEFEPHPSRDQPDTIALDLLSHEGAVAFITSQLSVDQAEVILLRVLGGLTAAETGTVLGRSESWVRVNQHRALTRLARRLEGRSL